MPLRTHRLWDQGALDGAPNKFEQIAQFYVGETITSLQKTALVPGRAEVLVYSTVMGSIGVLVPFVSTDDADFFNHLEMHLRSTITDMIGRDHLSFRSAFIPVKDVVDGDLCANFSKLTASSQLKIAEELDRSSSSVSALAKVAWLRFIFSG
uniref:RSE1/DDB1/CPSF1 C-terminal domain-containing protein n=1 Tax=Aplanochytrium stocchinoi TaxID=215587 RepID=A0A6S8AJ15_9STRA|mmetsp:Transcript_21114/g.25692  ORF Transcript_21114/g.25692 Transcript_21114/m.25692 type:complete len:152 (-) Transcript_21114:836-1291(-)